MNPFKQKELYHQLDNVIQDINAISQYSPNELAELISFLDGKPEWKRYNRLAFYSPYSYQKQWHEAAKHYRQRYLCAGNRLGKTFGMAAEMAMYLTGYYPDDWAGQKISYSSDRNVYLAIGIEHSICRKVLQKELLGTMDARRSDEIGTGTIPRDCIDLETIDRLGERVISCRVAHHDEDGEFDGWNELHFYSASQGQDSLMGIKVAGVWIDECPPNEEELYSQAWTRCLTTKGFVAVTATPERGLTNTLKKFMDNEEGYLYHQNVSMTEAPHLTKADIDEYLSTVPLNQREMRLHGVPKLGDGNVFPFTEEQINGTLSKYTIMEQPYRYKMMWGCDFGYANTLTADPSTLMLCAYDTEEDVIYCIQEWNSKDDRDIDILSNMPDYMANIILSSDFPRAPLIVPRDGNKNIEGTNTTRIAEFQRLGVNVYPRVFEIPKPITSGALGKPSNGYSLEWTIHYMSKLFSEDKLKLDVNSLPKLMGEYRQYVWKENKLTGKAVPRDRDNHHLDALRYAVVSIKHKGEPAYQCISSYRPELEYEQLNRELTSAFSNY